MRKDTPQKRKITAKTQKEKRGAFSIEYAVLIAIVIAALLGMQIFIKRSIMGRWRQAADTFGAGKQYEPGVTVVVE